jgi:hypothetical protein
LTCSSDYVRLKAGYSPPHWKKRATGKWDAGYETTGYFLAWLEDRCGKGTVQLLNESMKESKYESKVFKKIAGEPVGELWKQYVASLNPEAEQSGESAQSRLGTIFGVLGYLTYRFRG